jgi:putative SOS response-associated peptidase YedK
MHASRTRSRRTAQVHDLANATARVFADDSSVTDTAKMCGRLVVSAPDLSWLVEAFGVTRIELGDRVWTPRFNLAPTQLAPIVTNETERRVALARFGLIPRWAKDLKIGNKLINARVESIATRSAFRSALEQRRCIVPVNGYYEWQKTAHGKRPLFIHDAQAKPMPLAGIWETWRNGDSESLESFAIITRAACGFLADIHARMPLVVPEQTLDAWLDPHTRDARALASILNSEPQIERWRAWQVSSLINSSQNDGPECNVESVADAAARPSRLGQC